MDGSIQYNLRNPAITDDIGMSMIERQFPSTINAITGVPNFDIKDVKINNGQPQTDNYKGKSKKDKKESHWIRNSLIGSGAIGLAALGFFKGKSIFAAVKNFATNIISKIKS
ncbi:hypothetical protein J6G99_04840 [bacterium]|nr:hypothetical protein [bacterium]